VTILLPDVDGVWVIKPTGFVDCFVIMRALDDALFVRGFIGRQQHDAIGRHVQPPPGSRPLGNAPNGSGPSMILIKTGSGNDDTSIREGSVAVASRTN